MSKKEVTLEVNLKFKVPSSNAGSFTDELVARMHRYLSKEASTVYKVDTKIYD